jgi:hypothetical protein
MATSFFKCFFSPILCCFSVVKGAAQNLTGIWRGYFIPMAPISISLKYRSSKTKPSGSRGFVLVFKYRFLRQSHAYGNYNNAVKTALIQEIRTVELRMSGGSVACIMKCNFTYSRSGDEEFWKAPTPAPMKKAIRLLGIKRGGNCGGGKLFLRKVPDSDFYVEPFSCAPNQKARK